MGTLNLTMKLEGAAAFADALEKVDAKFKEALAIFEAIDGLRRDEGDFITCYNDNPDPGGPNSKVTISGYWSGFVDVDAFGDSLLDALHNAVELRKESEAGKGSSDG